MISLLLIFVFTSSSNNLIAQETISGTILQENGAPMEGVTVTMSGDQNMNVLTDANGMYSFSTINTGDNVVITPSFSPNNCQNDCINVLDLIHTRRMILNVDSNFPSPFGGINADINGNRIGNIDTNNPLNGISTFDVVLINKQILGVDEFTDCWKFVDASFVFPNSNDVNVSEIVFANIQRNEVANFTGLRTGDVNACMDNTGSDFLELQLPNIPTTPCNAIGTSLNMPLTVTDFNAIMGLQFSLNWDPNILQFQGISNFNSTINLNTGNINTQNASMGELNFAWHDDAVTGINLSDGEALLFLQFSVIDDQSTSIAFSDINTQQLVVNDQLVTSSPITTNGGLTVETACDSFNLSGVIVKAGSGDPLGGVTVNMTGDQIGSTQTDVFGNYSFSSIPSGSNVVVRPELAPNSCQNACINVLDNILISNHILGINQLSNPAGMVAADINRSGTLTSSDLVQLRQSILNINQLSNNTNCWSFLTSNSTDFNNFTEQTAVDDIQNNAIVDFTAVRTGDVDGCVMNTETDFLELEIGTTATTSCNALVTSFGLPITVSNFNSVMGLQFSINWDPTILQFQGINASNLISGGEINSANAANGELNVAWTDPNASGVTLADGTTFFDIQFSVIDDQSTTVSFSDINTHQLVVSDQLATSQPIVTDGGLRVDTVECDTVSLFLSDGSGNCGEEVCVEVTVEDFNNVGSFQYTMEWNSSILELSSIGQFGIADLNSANFSIDNTNGTLNTGWSDFAFSGVNLADGTVLFQLCFDLKEVENSSSTIDFSSAVSPIEFTDLNNVLGYKLTGGQISVNCPTPINLFGLAHESLGGLNITSDSNTKSIQILDSDNTGTQGLRVNLGESKGHSFSLSGLVIADEQVEDYIELTYFGGLNGQENSLIYQIRQELVTKNGDNYVSLSMSGPDGEEDEIYTVWITTVKDGEEISLEQYADIVKKDILEFKTAALPLDIGITVEDDVVILENKVAIELIAPDETMLTLPIGSTIMVKPVNQNNTIDYFNKMDLKVFDLNPLEYKEESVLLFEDKIPIEGLGNVAMTPSNNGNQITFEDFETKEEDGLNLALRKTRNTSAWTDHAEITLQQQIVLPLNNRSINQRNNDLINTNLRYQANGKIGNSDANEQELANVSKTVSSDNDLTTFGVDFSPIGSIGANLSIYNNNSILLDRTILNNETLNFFINSLPQSTSLSSTVRDELAFTFNYSDNQTFIFDNETITGNRLVISNTAAQPFWITDYQINGDGLDQFIITDASLAFINPDSCLPYFLCPSDVTISDCPASFDPTTIDAPIYIDSCEFQPTISVTATEIAMQDGEKTYELKWILAIDSVEVDTCMQMVIVQDMSIPTLICLDNPTIIIRPGTTLTLSHEDVLESFPVDSCGIDSLLIVPSTLDCSNLGNNELQITVIDNSGNSSSCTVAVTVTHGSLPTIECPDNVLVNSRQEMTPVNLPLPIVTNSCGEVTINCSKNSGDLFPCGTSTVTCTFTDEFGNEGNCSYNVIVDCETESDVVLADLGIPMYDDGLLYLKIRDDADNDLIFLPGNRGESSPGISENLPYYLYRLR